MQTENTYLVSISILYSATAMVCFYFANKNTNMDNIWMLNGMKKTVSNHSLSECYSICQQYYDRSPWNIISIIYASTLKNYTINIRQLPSVVSFPVAHTVQFSDGRIKNAFCSSFLLFQLKWSGETCVYLFLINRNIYKFPVRYCNQTTKGFRSMKSGP